MDADGLVRLPRAAGNAAVSALLTVQRQAGPSPSELTLPDFVSDAELEKAAQAARPCAPGVNKVQRALLMRLGYRMPKSTTKGGEADGKFGSETASVVRRFQSDKPST